MGFAATAALFEKRAREARDPDTKRRFVEAARFYRQLAGIAPEFPAGFKSNGHVGYADRWKARADECRAMADHFADPNCRAQMMRVADSYDRMAEAAE